MLYALIMVTVLSDHSVDARQIDVYPDMVTCFDHRDDVLVEGKHYTGYFPVGIQAVCIPVEPVATIMPVE